MCTVRAISGRGFLALVCSLLVAYQPASGFSGSFSRDDSNGSHGGAISIRGPIAMAKLTGSADRNGQPLLNGSIVSSGDSLQTHTNSALLLTAAPQERVWLGPNTSAKLTREAGTLGVSLERGTVGFESQGHIQVTLEDHDGLTLRSRTDAAVRAQLSFVSHQEARVKVQEGTLELVQGGRSVLLRPEQTKSLSASGSRFPSNLPAKTNSSQGADSAGQAEPGSITGTVVTKDLFAVSTANLTLTNTAGKTFETTSDQEGKFTFGNIPPGTYTLHVVKSGYQNYDLPNVVVRSANESSLYVQLGSAGMKKGNSSNNILIWVIVGGAAAGGIGAYLGTRGTKSTTSPSSLESVE